MEAWHLENQAKTKKVIHGGKRGEFRPHLEEDYEREKNSNEGGGSLFRGRA